MWVAGKLSAPRGQTRGGRLMRDDHTVGQKTDFERENPLLFCDDCGYEHRGRRRH